MRNGVPMVWRTAENVALVHKLCAEGLTYTEIGARLGVSPAVVQKANVKGVATTNEYNQEIKRAVLMMLESGVPQIQVARHFGVSAFSIRSWREAPKQREAACATHREGGATIPEIEPALAPISIRLALPAHVARMRDSLARHMPREAALREAMRVCAAKGSHDPHNAGAGE